MRGALIAGKKRRCAEVKLLRGCDLIAVKRVNLVGRSAGRRLATRRHQRGGGGGGGVCPRFKKKIWGLKICWMTPP
jgi:hypothetical protein